MNIIIAAVGGQGALLAARVIGQYALLKSEEVKVSEIHGMSQRGGSVVTHVRFGEKVHSPVIEVGTADVLLGFELLEAARAVHHLRPGGLLVVSKQQIPPLPVLTQAAEYPPALLQAFEQMAITTVAVDALSCATQIGNIKVVNTVLIGVLARRLSQDVDIWQKAVASCVPGKHLELNMRAFNVGYGLSSQAAARVGAPKEMLS